MDGETVRVYRDGTVIRLVVLKRAGLGDEMALRFTR